MRIAIVHSFYSDKIPSGENFVVLAQVKALQECGHEVKLISLATDQLVDSPLYRIKSALSVATGIGSDPQTHLRNFQPDITLVHNLFPNFGSSWMTNWNGPIVRVLHNFRLYCSNGLFYRDGHLCFECVEKSPIQGLAHACYKGSRLATLPLTIAQLRRGITQSEIDQPTGYFALSQVAAEALINAGLPQEKVFIVPNFIEDFRGSAPLPIQKRNGRWVAVGRLTREKGFYNLVKNWPNKFQLDIIGDGPDFDEIQRLTTEHRNIRLLGRLEKQELLNCLPHYEGAILSSLWKEVAPLTAIEFFCCGLPVISTAVNSAASIINEQKLGVVLDQFTSGTLKSAIELIMNDFDSYSHSARHAFETHYSQKVWTERAVSIFNQLA